VVTVKLQTQIEKTASKKKEVSVSNLISSVIVPAGHLRPFYLEYTTRTLDLRQSPIQYPLGNYASIKDRVTFQFDLFFLSI